MIMVWFGRFVMLVFKIVHAWILIELLLAGLFISMFNLVRVAHMSILYTQNSYLVRIF